MMSRTAVPSTMPSPVPGAGGGGAGGGVVGVAATEVPSIDW